MNALRIPPVLQEGNGVELIPPLWEVLSLLELEGCDLRWTLLGFEAEGYSGDAVVARGRSLLLREIEEAASQRGGGLLLRWEELNRLARQTTEVLDVLIAATNRSEESPTHAWSDRRLLTDTEILLVNFDSTWWTLAARSDQVLERAQRRFPAATSAPLVEGPLHTF